MAHAGDICLYSTHSSLHTYYTRTVGITVTCMHAWGHQWTWSWMWQRRPMGGACPRHTNMVPWTERNHICGGHAWMDPARRPAPHRPPLPFSYCSIVPFFWTTSRKCHAIPVYVVLRRVDWTRLDRTSSSQMRCGWANSICFQGNSNGPIPVADAT